MIVLGARKVFQKVSITLTHPLISDGLATYKALIFHSV